MSGKAVPELRFPEFEGQWEKCRLKEIAAVSDGTHQTPNYVDEGVPFYSVEHLTANQFSKTRFISEKVFNAEKVSRIPKRGDVLMTRIGDVGTAKYLDWDVKAAIYVSLALLKPKENTTGSYLASAINADTTQRRLHALTIHVAFPKKINLRDLEQVEVDQPAMAEQNKIAAFFSAVDAKLTALEQQVEGWNSFKRGLMQTLFSQRLRFRDDDGAEFPDWKTMQVSQLFSFKKTNSLSRSVLSGEGRIRNIHYGDIHTKYSSLFSSRVEHMGKVPRAFEQKAGERLKEGDLVIADASEDYADIGKAIEILDLDGLHVVAGLHTIVARPKPANFASGFLAYSFASWPMRKSLMKIANGASVLGISKTNLAKVSITVPSLPEQRKIADTLSAVDRKIDALSDRLDAMRNFKRGLLQKMFV